MHKKAPSSVAKSQVSKNPSLFPAKIAKTIVLCSALLICVGALNPCFQCANGKGDQGYQNKNVLSSLEGSTETSVDIHREQKKLRKEVAALHKASSIRIGQLEGIIAHLDWEIYKIELNIRGANANGKEWEHIQEMIQTMARSIHMKLDPIELNKVNIRKTLQKIKEALTGEIGKIEVEKKQLREGIDAHVAELEAKAEAKFKSFYAEKMDATRSELGLLSERYQMGGGTMDLKREWSPEMDNLRNQIMDLESKLYTLKWKSATFDLEHEACASEKAEIEAANRLFEEKNDEILGNARQFDAYLREIDLLANKTVAFEINKRPLPSSSEMKKMQKMQSDVKTKRALLIPLNLHNDLAKVLMSLVDCLSIRMLEKCKERREKAEWLGQKVAQSPNEWSQSVAGGKVQSGGEFEEFFGFGGNYKKLTNCLAKITSLYEGVVKE